MGAFSDIRTISDRIGHSEKWSRRCKKEVISFCAEGRSGNSWIVGENIRWRKFDESTYHPILCWFSACIWIIEFKVLWCEYCWYTYVYFHLKEYNWYLQGRQLACHITDMYKNYVRCWIRNVISNMPILMIITIIYSEILQNFHDFYSLRCDNSPMYYTRMQRILIDSFSLFVSDINTNGFHSRRAGGATATANLGIPDRLLKRHGRWRSETANDGYVQTPWLKGYLFFKI